MAVPRNRHSLARSRKGRAHHAKKPKSLVSCTNCGTPRLPHVMCSGCGTYKNRNLIAQD